MSKQKDRDDIKAAMQEFDELGRGVVHLKEDAKTTPETNISKHYQRPYNVPISVPELKITKKSDYHRRLSHMNWMLRKERLTTI